MRARDREREREGEREAFIDNQQATEGRLVQELVPLVPA